MTSRRRTTTGLLVVRRGRIAYEWYAAGWGPDRPHGTASMAKALVGGMSLLVAISDGAIAADDLASNYIPRWRGDPAEIEDHDPAARDPHVGDRRRRAGRFAA